MGGSLDAHACMRCSGAPHSGPMALHSVPKQQPPDPDRPARPPPPPLPRGVIPTQAVALAKEHGGSGEWFFSRGVFNPATNSFAHYPDSLPSGLMSSSLSAKTSHAKRPPSVEGASEAKRRKVGGP
jgi:hypothetical protein